MFLSSAVTIYKPAIGPQRHIPPWRGLFPDQMIYNFLKIILYLYKILFKKSLNRRKGYKTPAAFLVLVTVRFRWPFQLLFQLLRETLKGIAVMTST